MPKQRNYYLLCDYNELFFLSSTFYFTPYKMDGDVEKEIKVILKQTGCHTTSSAVFYKAPQK
jgi:hypothetical protein